VWDFNSGEMLQSYNLGNGGFSVLPYLTDDGRLRFVVGPNTSPYRLAVIDHATKSRFYASAPAHHTKTVTHIFEVPLPDKTVFVTTGNDGTTRLWDREEFSLLDTIVVEKRNGTQDYSAYAYDFIWGAVPYHHPDGRTLLVVTSISGKVLLYDLSDKTFVCSHDPPDGRLNADAPPEETPLGLDTYTTAEGGEDRLVVGTYKGCVRLYSLPDLRFIRVLAEVGNSVRAVRVFDSPSDGRCLVAAGSDTNKVTIVGTGDYRRPRGNPREAIPVRSALKTG
jgi:WD40 repeat protein